MRKVLICSYACCPGLGSEKGMGWNWVTNIARFCETHVITESEFQSIVEQWIKEHSNDTRYSTMLKNLHFHWNTIGGDNNLKMTKKIRQMCWNQGDWRFYFYYHKWMKSTAQMANRIIKEEANKMDADGNIHGIDILHQLNMIGFREPGMFWKLSKETGIPFIWGPVGGLKQYPLIYGGSTKMRLFFWVKNLITRFQIRFQYNVRQSVLSADSIISAIQSSQDMIKKVYSKDTILINDQGCNIITNPLSNEELDARDNNKTLEVIWIGKFDYRKRLDIALNVVKYTNMFCTDTPRVRLSVYGSGTKRQTDFFSNLCKAYKIEQWVDFKGQCNAETIKEAMRRSNIMLFTSVNEDTATVIMEAMENQLPVLCFDCCGMSNVIDESIGRKIKLSNPEQSADELADSLLFFHENREELRKRALNCLTRHKEFSWDSKMEKLMELYDNAKVTR